MVFSFPNSTIKTSRRYFLLLIRTYNFRVFISRRPPIFSQERELDDLPVTREAIRVHFYVSFAFRLPLYSRLTSSANHLTL